MHVRRLLLTLSLIFGATTLVIADDHAWNQLSTQEQALLKKMELDKKWGSLNSSQRENYRRGAKRWLAMNESQRRHAQERMRAWQQMAPVQRERLVRRYQWFNNLPVEEQVRLRRIQRWFQGLPPDRQQEIRHRWKTMPEVERQQFDQERDERRQFRRVMHKKLQQMNPEERAAVWKEFLNKSPEERRKYRRQMLSTPDESQ